MDFPYIIDTHTWLGKAPEFGVHEDTGPVFRNPMFGNTRFLTIPFSAAKNREVIERVAADDRFLGCYLVFNPNIKSPLFNEHDRQRSIEELISNEHVVGLKTVPSLTLVPIDHEYMYPYYETIARAGKPILLHFSATDCEYTSAEKLMRVITLCPEVTVIAAHLGGLRPEYMSDVIEVAKNNDNVYLNTTNLDPEHDRRQASNRTNQVHSVPLTYTREEVLPLFNRALGLMPERILFGSDLGWYGIGEFSTWPVSTLTNQEMQLVFYENARKLFGLGR